MMNEKYEITIDRFSHLRWIRTLVGGTFFLLGPIVFGVVLDSSAMQWVGFIFGIILFLSFLIQQDKKRRRCRTFDEAHAILDDWEAQR